MKLETNLEGLNAIFKPYQIHIFDILLDVNGIRLGSGDVWRSTNKRLPEGSSISRASVIFFLNDLVEDGLADCIEKTGKGGYRRMYQLLVTDRDDLNKVIVDRFLLKLFDIFPEHEKLKAILREED